MNRYVAAAGALLCGCLIVLSTAGCTPSGHHAATSASAPGNASGSAAPTGTHHARLAKLRAHLPPGFTALSSTAPPSAARPLTVTPVTALHAATMHAAPFPTRAALRPILAAVVNQPVTIHARPLYLNHTPAPGTTVTVVADGLPSTPAHDVLYILQAPNGRWTRLVAEQYGLAAGAVHIPTNLGQGTCYLIVEDISPITATPSGTPAGYAIVELTQFQTGS